ncbi:unnamed protein product, partial [Owenia fusiformis]
QLLNNKHLSLTLNSCLLKLVDFIGFILATKAATMGLTEYTYDDSFTITPGVLKVYNRDGGFLVRGLLDKIELEMITKTLENKEIVNHGFDLADGDGRASKLALWSHPGSDVTGMMARSEKVAGSCAKLLGGEVYHYHTKLMMKEPKTGGKHLWHQDYGYWYKNGNLRPDMITAYIAVDKCVKENGCLQVVVGTHNCGRIDHNLVHGQTVADDERVKQLCAHHEHIFVEMNPGDCLFFHCNLLHTSDKNDSDLRRWAFLCSYNRADNDPVYKHHHPNYTPLEMVPNSAIKECKNFTDFTGKEFMDPNSDKTTNAALKKSGYH